MVSYMRRKGKFSSEKGLNTAKNRTSNIKQPCKEDYVNIDHCYTSKGDDKTVTEPEATAESESGPSKDTKLKKERKS